MRIRFAELLREDYAKWKDEEYLFFREGEGYRSVTFGAFIEDVVCLAESLLSRGLKGGKIAVCGENSPRWMAADLAVSAYVGVSVGLSREYGPEEIRESIETFGIDALFYSAGKEAEVKEAIKAFPELLCFNMEKDFSSLLEEGRRKAEKKAGFFDFEEKDPDACVKVVLTAGTTSDPKGVMLSEKNIFAGWESLAKRAPMDRSDRCYLFLPLHHTYAGIYNFIYSLISGMKLYLSSGTAHIARELHLATPTVFCAVPVIYRNFYEASGGDPEKLTSFFGGKIKYLFTGGAPLEPEIRAFYHRAGLNLLSAYALSETASSLAIAYSGSRDTVSAGRVFEDLEVKIADPDKEGRGEILVRGEAVFLGYMNDEKATRAVFDEEGFFRTGDIGRLDGENNIYITGRKKKVLLTGHGENIYPDAIEAYFRKRDPDINKVKVFTAGDELRAEFYIAQKRSPDCASLVEEYNRSAPGYRKIRRFRVLADSVDKRMKQ